MQGQLPTITAQQAKEACDRFMFTPGPWEVSNPYKLRRRTAIDISKHGGTICTIWEDDSEQIANARLISAAPGMLAALVAVLKWVDNPEMIDALKLSVTNAIDKSTK